MHMYECDGPEFRRRILYLHHAVKEIFLEKTYASVKQSGLPLQAAAEKLTSDFEKSCANPKIDQKSYANIATKIGSGGWVKTTSLRLCEENANSPYQNETLEIKSYMFPVGCRTRL